MGKKKKQVYLIILKLEVIYYFELFLEELGIILMFILVTGKLVCNFYLLSE